MRTGRLKASQSLTKRDILSEESIVMVPAITEDDIYAELGKIVAGHKEGRTSPDEITRFKATGLAIQDVGTAYKVYQLAKEKGIGTTLAG